MESSYRDYGFPTEAASHMYARFMPVILQLIGELPSGTGVLDVGCGNGAACGALLRRGFRVVGVDLSKQGIDVARRTYPEGRFELLAADSHILGRLREEAFDVVISTEVVEHLYDPRSYARGCFEALKPGGRFICTTPYHGYVKNLVLSVLGKWDSHANPLWDGGHIKLWSRRTLTQLLTETGFTDPEFRGVGRFPGLWMTMVMASTRPARVG